MTSDNGGPAFPQSYTATPSDDLYPDIPGMTLRDYFAGQALVGLLGSGIAAERGHQFSDVAEIAYENADAMLAERNKADTP